MDAEPKLEAQLAVACASLAEIGDRARMEDRHGMLQQDELICVVVAEMTGADSGLGYRLYSAYLVFRVDRMLACMAFLALAGASADRLFCFITARIFPWIALSHDR